MKFAAALLLLASTMALCAAEKPVVFVPAKADPLVGDYEGEGIVAQVIATDGGYRANLFQSFDSLQSPTATIACERSGEKLQFKSDDASLGRLDSLHRVERESP